MIIEGIAVKEQIWRTIYTKLKMQMVSLWEQILSLYVAVWICFEIPVEESNEYEYMSNLIFWYNMRRDDAVAL